MNGPKIGVSELREIGWALWDPIGLREVDGGAPEGAEDEYDTYLMRVAGMLINGRGISAAAGYLAAIESDHMGLGVANLGAIEATVLGIRNRLMELGYTNG